MKAAENRGPLGGINCTLETKSTVDVGVSISRFFDVRFAIVDEMHNSFGGGMCSLPCSLFKVFKWKSDFKVSSPVTQTHAHVWIQIRGLSCDY